MFDLGEELGRTSEIVAPCVCRTSPGSHTTIVVAVKDGHVRHVPMDAEGLRVIVSRYDDFVEEYVRTPYSPVEAAKKYMAAKHIACDPLARTELERIIDPTKENVMSESTTTAAEESNKPARSSASSKKRAERAQAIADSAAKHKAASDAKKAAKAKADKPAKTAAKTKADKPTKTATKKTNGSGRGLGIGAFCKEQILAGVDSEKIVEKAQAKFPGCKVNLAHISWYRGRLKEEGLVK